MVEEDLSQSFRLTILEGLSDLHFLDHKEIPGFQP